MVRKMTELYDARGRHRLTVETRYVPVTPAPAQVTPAPAPVAPVVTQARKPRLITGQELKRLAVQELLATAPPLPNTGNEVIKIQKERGVQ